MKKNLYYIIAGVLLFLIVLNVLFYFISPVDIVGRIGIENTYIIVLALAIVGGLSTFTGAVLFTTIAAFAAGGANPLLLGIAGGIGIFISDSIFFGLATIGRRAVPDKWEHKVQKISGWIKKHPSWMVLALMYVYIGMSPLPNDILMVALVIGEYSYKKIIWVLLAGSLTIALLTAYFGELWWSVIFG